MNDWMTGRFSIPFSGDDPGVFMATLAPLWGYVHDVYLGVEEVFPQGNRFRADQLGNVRRFIDRCAASVKVYVTLNIVAEDAAGMLSGDAVRFLRDSGVSGVIVADPLLAQRVQALLPDLEIDSSINSVVHDPCDPTGPWAGVRLASVNVMRNDGYDLPRMRRLAAVIRGRLGAKVKLMVNANCVRRCPYTLTHLRLDTLGALGQITRAEHARRVSAFVDVDPLAVVTAQVRSCVVLPRWIHRYADCVDILKIDGKGLPAAWIARCLKAYVDGDDGVLFADLADGTCWHDFLGTDRRWAGGRFPVSLIPDELATCGARGCEECSVCAKAAKRVHMYLRVFT